jgi:N-acetylneuraminate synthase
MNLRTLPDLARRFSTPAGLSDHSHGLAAAVAAVPLGACVVEKHLTLARDHGGPDSAFSLEPDEFAAMVAAVRTTEAALGKVHYGETGEAEGAMRVFRRSLFVVEDMAAGECFTPDNLRSIRPGHGLAPRYYDAVLGCPARRAIRRGTPLSWELVADGVPAPQTG